MKDWIKITGLEANRIAEEQHIARPGTFNAIVLKWAGNSQPPSFVKLKGTVQCLGCSRSTPFQLEGMSGQVTCAGCRATYQLFNDSRDLGGVRTFILVASVFSRPVSSPSSAPQVDVSEVAPW
jgi:hypothetical protein